MYSIHSKSAVQINPASKNISETLKGMVPLKCNLIYTHVHTLACPHVCTNMCPVTSDGTLTVPTCYAKGCTHANAARVDIYVGTYTYATRVSATCSIQSLRRIDVCSFA